MRLSWEVFTEISLRFDIQKIQFEQLVALKLDWRYRLQAVESDSFMLSFAHLPSLRRLFLTEFQPWFNIPLHSITTLGPMIDWSVSGVVHALTKCHNVDSFTVAFVYEHFEPEILPPIVINARSLDITTCNHDVRLASLLNLLTAPQLENLACKGVLEGERWQTALHDFISRSQCPLKTLIIHCDYAGEYFPRLLSLLPTLTNLTLHCDRGTVLDASVFDGLITAVESSSLVPQLQLLILSCCSFRTEIQPLLLVSRVLTMAESRSRSLKAIRLSIELYVRSRNECDLDSESCDLDPESLLRQQRLNESGMEVSIALGPLDA
jgi:hypothetical protein